MQVGAWRRQVSRQGLAAESGADADEDAHSATRGGQPCWSNRRLPLAPRPAPATPTSVVPSNVTTTSELSAMSESCVWPHSGDRSSMVCSMISGSSSMPSM